jgi:putative phage-type endonuclease
MNRLEWLYARQKSVGASDAANLVGVGWRTAADVYREKTEPVDDRTPTDGPLARGIALEPIVAARYKEVMGVEIVSPIYNATLGNEYSITYHPDRPWQSASLDRRRADNGATISLKTTAGFGEEWGENGSADVPEVYRVQSCHEMGVTQTTMLDLAALDVIRWELRVYRLDFDAAYFEWLTGVERRFWNYVEERTPPPVDWDDTVRPIHDRRVIRLGTIDLGDDMIAILERRKELKRIADEADDEAKRLTTQVDLRMGNAERGVAGPWRLRRSLVKGAEVKFYRKDSYRLTITEGRGE